jgi:shikimate dehydrogenase
MDMKTNLELERLMKGPEVPAIFALFGFPVVGNPTQYMLEKAFQTAGVAARYVTLEVKPADLGAAIAGMRAMDFQGANITVPHKIKVIQHLDRLSTAAKMIGAVNCIIREGDELIGENTDGKGFLQSLTEQIDPQGKQVVLLGAGGAARAVGIELALAGASRITVVNRSETRGQDLATALAEVGIQAAYTPLPDNYFPPDETDILINATSIGLNHPEQALSIAWQHVRPGVVVADVVFNPPETKLLKQAKSIGCSTIDGLGMLVNQGVIAFKYWTGVQPDAAVMREALEESFRYG